MPAVDTIRIDTEGEIQNTTFTLRESPLGNEQARLGWYIVIGSIPERTL